MSSIEGTSASSLGNQRWRYLFSPHGYQNSVRQLGGPFATTHAAQKGLCLLNPWERAPTPLVLAVFAAWWDPSSLPPALCSAGSPDRQTDRWTNSQSPNCTKTTITRACLTAQWVKNPPAMQKTQETQVQYLGWEDPLEEEMTTHFRILAWEIPWTEEPGRLQPKGSQRVRHDWATNHTHPQGDAKGSPEDL